MSTSYRAPVVHFVTLILLLGSMTRLGLADNPTNPADAKPAATEKAADKPSAGNAAPAEKSMAIEVANVQLGHPINFAQDVLPIFRSNCVACHNAKESKGGLILETPKSIRTGGDSGPAALAAKPNESLILMAAAHRQKPFMPPRNNKVSAQNLSPRELGILKLWIEQGAGGDETLKPTAIQWRAIPATLRPIYSVAITQDGQYAACGRGNDIFIYDLPARRLVTKLSDPALAPSADATARGPAHRDLVQSLAFSPDGFTLASGGFREVKLWSRPRPTLLQTLADAHAKGNGCLAISPNGKALAVAGEDQVIRLFSLPSGKPMRELKGHQGAITALGFAEEGAKLCSGSMDKTVRVWSIAQDAEPTVIETPSEVLAVGVLADNRIVTGGADKIIRVWHDGKSEKDKQITAPTVANVIVTADGPHFAAGTKEGAIRWYDADTMKQVTQFDLSGEAKSLAIGPGAAQLLAAGPSKVIRIWNLKDNKQQAQCTGDRDLSDQARLVERKLAFANNEVQFVKASIDEATRRQTNETQSIKNLTTAVETADKAMGVADKNLADKNTAKDAADKLVTEVNASMTEAQSAKDSAEKDLLAAKSAVDDFAPKLAKAKAAVDSAKDNDARKAAAADFADAQKNADELKAKVTAATTARDQVVQKIAMLTDKQRDLTTKAKDAAKQAVDADTVATQAKINLKSAKLSLEASKDSLAQAEKEITGGKTQQQTAEALVASTRTELESAQKALNTAGSPIAAALFAPEGGVVYSAGDDGAIRSWSAATGLPGPTLHRDGKAVIAMASGASGILAVATTDGTVELWNIAGQWTLGKTIGNGTEDSALCSRVCALAFSPDGALLATGSGVPSRTGELKLWKANDATLVREIVDAHSDVIQSICFSADGKSLASGGADKFVKLFNVETGKLIHSFEGTTEQILSVSLRYDGRIIASAAADNRTRFWNVLTGEQKEVNQSQQTYGLQPTFVGYIGMSDTALVTAGDGSVRLVREDGITRNLQTNGAFFYCGAATPDGQTLIAGAHDSTLWTWDGRDQSQPPVKFEADPATKPDTSPKPN